MRHEIKSKDCSLAGLSDLTVIAPIRPSFVPALDAVTYKTRVKRVLRTLHAGRGQLHEVDLARLLSDAVERVGRIHSVRIAVLEPENAVLLAVTFDGAWESYVRVIWEKVARLLDLVFCNTEGYVNGWRSGYDEWGRWLRSRQAETSFLYARPGVTVDDLVHLRMQERLDRAGGVGAELAITRVRAPSADEIAQGLFKAGADPTNPVPARPLDPLNEARPMFFRQGLRSLAGLYRLADVYPPGSEDGALLLDAAHELLPEFLRLVRLDSPDRLDPALQRAAARFAEPLRWISAPVDVPAAREMPTLAAAPALDRPDQIQGGILEPYADMDHAALLLLAFDSAAALQAFLTAFVPTAHGAQGRLGPGDLACNIAFPLEGLRLAGLTDAEIETLPTEFVQGMERRAGLLGDLRVNHPRRWRLPPRNWVDGIDAADVAEDDAVERVPLAAVHAVVQVRRLPPAAPDADRRIGRGQILARLQRAVACHAGVVPLSLQWLERQRNGAGAMRDHFRFLDGQSDPVLRGDQAGLYYSNQVQPGEALLGYANAVDPAPALPRASAWVQGLLTNGSFLVVRKLRQDVGVLERALDAAVAANAPTGIDRDTVLGKMMGRYPDGHAQAGEPLVKRLAGATNANDFVYNDDPGGTACPLQAHVRRANPRPLAAIAGERPPRLFRRSISYGPWHDRDDTDLARKAASLRAERGILFMAYNASLGEQFELVQRWLAGGNSAGGQSSPGDPFVGIAEPGRPRCLRFEHNAQTVRMTLDGDTDPSAEPAPIVRLEWGGYFFAPSLEALRQLAERAGRQPARHGVAPRWSVEQGEAHLARLLQIEAAQGTVAALDAWKAALEDADAAADFSTASIWAAIRARPGGALRTPYGVLVADRALVQRVLSDADAALTSAGYLGRMRQSFGAIYLGLDAHQEDGRYEREAPACNDAIGARDPAATRSRAHAVTTAELDALVAQARRDGQEDEQMRRDAGAAPRPRVHWELTVDVKELIDELLAVFCEEWFGLTAVGDHFQRAGFSWNWQPGEPPCYPGHFMAPSRYIFQPHPAPTVESVGAAHGVAMRSAMNRFLVAQAATLTAPVARAVLDSPACAGDLDLAARTLIGAMMGMVPTVDANLRRVVDQWLVEGTLAALRAQRPGVPAARIDDAFLAAMQSRPAPDTLWRTARRGFALGGSGAAAVAIAPNDIVVAGLASVAQQGLENPAAPLDVAVVFGADGGAAGTPTHACPGYQPALAMMQGFVAALVDHAGALRAGAGPLTLALEGYEPFVGFAPAAGAAVWRESVTGLEAGAPLSGHDLVRTLRLVRTARLDAGRFAAALSKVTPLYALGDSWLADLPPPLADLVDELPALGYGVVKRDAQIGQKLAEMVVTAKLAAVTLPPGIQAILLGGGGNDLVQPSPEPTRTRLFELLRPTEPSGLDGGLVTALIDTELIGHYRKILRLFRGATAVPILIHAYGFPVPDGRPATFTVLGHTYTLGPWLRSVFGAKGMTDLAFNAGVMHALIKRLNAMVATVAAEFADVHHVDLTSVLNHDPGDLAGYQAHWANELHATQAGYALVARKIADTLAAVGVAPAAGFVALP